MSIRRCLVWSLALAWLWCNSVWAAGPQEIRWNAPTTNTDNTPITDLAGYLVSWGLSSGQYTSELDVGNRLSYPLAGLTPGTWFFAVKAYDQGHQVSSFSNEIQVIIPGTPPPITSTTVAINAGGSAYTATDGTIYKGDTYYSGGDTNWANQDPIANTADPVLYRGNRYGTFGYAIPLASGAYTLTLQFAEVYYGSPGQRRFDVLAEGQTIVSNLDLIAVAGHDVAYDVVVPVTVQDGTLTLEFTPLQDHALVSAIRIAPAVVSVPTGASGLEVTLQAK
jgi:hypothetical protein